MGSDLTKPPWWSGLTQDQRINHGSPRCGDWSAVLTPLQLSMQAVYLTWSHPRIVAYCDRVFEQLAIRAPAPPDQHYAMPYTALEALLYSLLDAYEITGLYVGHVPPEERIYYVAPQAQETAPQAGPQPSQPAAPSALQPQAQSPRPPGPTR